MYCRRASIQSCVVANTQTKRHTFGFTTTTLLNKHGNTSLILRCTCTCLHAPTCEVKMWNSLPFLRMAVKSMRVQACNSPTCVCFVCVCRKTTQSGEISTQSPVNEFPSVHSLCVTFREAERNSGFKNSHSIYHLVLVS